jgi:hypothetical protein
MKNYLGSVILYQNWIKFCLAVGTLFNISIALLYFQNADTFNFSNLTTTGQWSLIWNQIFKFLKLPHSTIQIECLSTIRLLSRDKSYLNETITEGQIDCLLNIANIGANNLNLNVNVQTESLKCLCNLVFQSVRCQEYCLKNACVDGIVKRLRTYK